MRLLVEHTKNYIIFDINAAKVLLLLVGLEIVIKMFKVIVGTA